MPNTFETAAHNNILDEVQGFLDRSDFGASSSTIPTSNGGSVTVSTSGQNNSVGYTSGNETVTGDFQNGTPSSITASGSIPLGGGLGATFTDGYNFGTGIGTHTVGLGYKSGGFTLSGSTNGNVTTITGMLTKTFW